MVIVYRLGADLKSTKGVGDRGCLRTRPSGTVEEKSQVGPRNPWY